MSKYSGITEHNKAAFDAIIPVVKEAIEKGIINVGGTKLYKHVIKVEKASNQQEVLIDIISNVDTPLVLEKVGDYYSFKTFIFENANFISAKIYGEAIDSDFNVSNMIYSIIPDDHDDRLASINFFDVTSISAIDVVATPTSSEEITPL